jgi:hypothetical protein
MGGPKKIMIHIHAGPSDGIQIGPFRHALRTITRAYGRSSEIEVIVEFKFNEELKRDGWTPNDLVEWLQEAHIYFILTHVHQAMLHWDASAVHGALPSLDGNM